MSHSTDIRSTFFEFNEAGIFSKPPFEGSDHYPAPCVPDLFAAQELIMGREFARHIHPSRLSSPIDHYLRRSPNSLNFSQLAVLDHYDAFVNIARESIEPAYLASARVEPYTKSAYWVQVRRDFHGLEGGGIYSGAKIAIDSSCRRYQRAFDRLSAFQNEQRNWDGCEGRPASPEVVKELSQFLCEAEAAEVEQPSLALGNDGSVAAVWQNDLWYMTAVFSGVGDYIYVVSKTSEITASGSHSGGSIAGELFEYLIGYSREDEQSGL